MKYVVKLYDRYYGQPSLAIDSIKVEGSKVFDASMKAQKVFKERGYEGKFDLVIYTENSFPLAWTIVTFP